MPFLILKRAVSELTDELPRFLLSEILHFASKLHGTKRMFLRTFWWRYNKDKDDFTLPPHHNYLTITRMLATNSCNSENVLKNVLQITKVSFLSPLAHQATKTQAHGLFLERETQLFFYIMCGCLKKERSNKNVLKNILHMEIFTTCTFLLSK